MSKYSILILILATFIVQFEPSKAQYGDYGGIQNGHSIFLRRGGFPRLVNKPSMRNIIRISNYNMIFYDLGNTMRGARWFPRTSFQPALPSYTVNGGQYNVRLPLFKVFFYYQY